MMIHSSGLIVFKYEQEITDEQVDVKPFGALFGFMKSFGLVLHEMMLVDGSEMQKEAHVIGLGQRLKKEVDLFKRLHGMTMQKRTSLCGKK